VAASYSANADLGANWPLVAGVGILAALLFYALYIVNGQLNQADNLVGGTASDVQKILSPITGLFSWLGGLFSSSSNSDQ
jgi:hypothetical protein